MFRLTIGPVIFLIQIAVAIPRFTIREGATCSTCHVNPTGGGLRNDYGIAVVSLDELPIQRTGDKSEGKDWGALSDHLRIGADVRLQILSYSEGDVPRKTILFPMQVDIYGHLTISKVVDIYMGIDALPDNLNNHEVWLSLNFPHLNGYIQMGIKTPTYGLTLDDHTSFIRGGNIRRTHGLRKEGMPFSPFTPPIKIVEVGMTVSDLFLTASLSNGFIYGEDKTINARIEHTKSWDSFTSMTGVSFLREQNLTLTGIFGGFSLGALTWSGEVDVAQNWVREGTSLASYSEVVFEPRQGINLLAKFDLFDVDIDFTGNALTRYTVGLDIFPFRFFEIKTQARITSVAGSETYSKPELLFQFHTWF